MVIDVVTSAPGPVHRGQQIADGFRRTLELAGKPPVAQPGQELLDMLLSLLLAPTPQPVAA